MKNADNNHTDIVITPKGGISITAQEIVARNVLKY